MSFTVYAFTLAGFCLLFGALAYYVSIRTIGIAKTILALFSVSYIFLSLFSVLVGTGYAVELTNVAPCENVINSTTVNGNLTTYTYIDSCASSNTPISIQRLYQGYSYILLTVILVSVLAVMFLGLRSVVFKW